MVVAAGITASPMPTRSDGPFGTVACGLYPWAVASFFFIPCNIPSIWSGLSVMHPGGFFMEFRHGQR